MKQRTKVSLTMWVSLLVVVLLGSFFLIPTYFGDRMVSQPPAEYVPIVLANAQKYDMDPFIILGLCMQESGFNPTAVSSANARGMTQIVPSTAVGIAKMIDKPNYDLFNPSDSVEMGTAYLKSLVDRYGGNIYTALAAYNMGTGNVDPGYRMGYDFSNHRYAAGVANYARVYKELYPGIFDNVAVATVNLDPTNPSSTYSPPAVTKKYQDDFKIKFEESARKEQGSTTLYSSVWKAYFSGLFKMFGGSQ